MYYSAGRSWYSWPCYFAPSHCGRSLWLSSCSGGDLSSTVRWFCFQNVALFIQLDDTVFFQVLRAIGWKQTLTSVGVPCVIWAAISNNPVWLIGFDFSPFLANNPLAGGFFRVIFQNRRALNDREGCCYPQFPGCSPLQEMDGLLLFAMWTQVRTELN